MSTGNYTRRLGKYGHKRTYFCPIKGCNYTSRKMIVTSMDNKISSHSDNCPHHNTTLILEKDKKHIENDVAFCGFNGCNYTQKHDDGNNCCPVHKQPLYNLEKLK